MVIKKRETGRTRLRSLLTAYPRFHRFTAVKGIPHLWESATRSPWGWGEGWVKGWVA